MGRHIRALLIPSDGSPIHMIHLKTIAIEANAPNPELGHHPDFRKYWGLKGWERRVATPLQISNEPASRVNGKYWLFRTLADAHLELNQHVKEHCFGDAFVVMVLEDGGDERGDAAYVDVSREVLGNKGVVERMVEKLGAPTEM